LNEGDGDINNAREEPNWKRRRLTVKLPQPKLKYPLHIRLLAQRAASAPLTLEEMADDELLAVLNLGYSLLERRIERLKAKEVRECIERKPEVWKWIRWALYVRDRILRG